MTRHEQQTQTIDVPPSTRAQRSRRASVEPGTALNAPSGVMASQPRRGRPPKVPAPDNKPPTARTPKGRKTAKPAPPAASASTSSDEASDEDGTGQGTIVYKPANVANDSHHVELSSDEENDENLEVVASITFKGTGKRALDKPDGSCTALADTQVPSNGQGKRMRRPVITRTPFSPRSNLQQVVPDETSQAAELCTVNCSLFPATASISQNILQSNAPACAPLPPPTAAAAIVQQPAVVIAAGAAASQPAAEVFDPSSEEHVLMARSALSVSRAQNFGDADVDASEAPVGRQQQFDQLLALLEQSGQHPPSRGVSVTGSGISAAASSGSQTVYASGLPGTGKSLTVTALLRSMRSQPLPPATVWVSCNAFKETSEVFAILLRECTLELIGRADDRAGWDQE